MLKSYTEPQFGSDKIPASASVKTIDKKDVTFGSSSSMAANGGAYTASSTASSGSSADDKERYRQKIAAMISGVSSEVAGDAKSTSQRKSGSNANASHLHERFSSTPPAMAKSSATDIRILKAKAASTDWMPGTPSMSHSDNDLNTVLAFAGDTSSGHSQSSSQSGSMCNLLGASSILGDSQTSLAIVSSRSEMPSSSSSLVTMSGLMTSNLAMKTTFSSANSSNSSASSSARPFRVNLAALLNDPRPGKRPVYVFSKLYGEAFERTASMPIPPFPNPIYNNPTTLDHSKYIKVIRKRTAHQHHQASKNNLAQQAPERPSSPTSQDLSAIPQEFFQTTFSLSNPDTFYSLFSWLRHSGKSLNSATPSSGSGGNNIISGAASSSNEVSQSEILHGRLSMYLDIVEAEISRQVSSRSDSFFATMTSQDVLQNYLAQTLIAVQSLRAKLKNVHSSFVVNPMQIMRLAATRSRHAQVFKKLRLIATVAGTQSTIQVLLSSGDYSGAIDLIRTTQEVVAEDLHGIVAFRYLPVQLAEVERTIDTMLCDEIRDCLSRELTRPVVGELTAPSNIAVVDETRLIGIALGLLKLHRFVFLEALQEEAATAVKAVTRSSAIQAVESAESVANMLNNPNITLEDQIRQLSPSEWLSLIQTMFANVTLVIDRVDAIRALLMDLVLMAAGKHSASTPATTTTTATSADEPPQRSRLESTSTSLIAATEDTSNLRLPETVFLKLKAQFVDTVYAISDFTQQRCIKVLTIRHQQRGNGSFSSSDRASVNDFLSFSVMSEKLVSRLAEFLERPSKTLPAGSPLSAFVHCQMARFIQQFHEERRHKMTEILDTEMWKPAVVPADFQRLMDVVLENKRLVLLPSSPSAESTASSASDVIATSTPTKTIRIAEEEFCVAGTSLMLFRLIVDYGDCATRMPSAASDLVNKVVELLKTFNSRTCQLVLGAGAVQLLGLRTITAGHLALSARSLEFILRLLPLVRSHFAAVLSSADPSNNVPLTRYIDQLERDYSDHVNEITGKILSVVDGAIGEQFVKWEAKPPVPSPLVKTVCSQLRRLHDSVSNIMPAPIRAAMFTKVASSFRDQMANRLRQLDIKLESNTSACGLLSQEIAFFNQELRSFNLGVANLSISEFMSSSQTRRP